MTTPTTQSFDYKIILIGDSAHPSLPTSAHGAGQAIEDRATIAKCLELARKATVPLALRTCEKPRYSRASSAQDFGNKRREFWHKTDFEAPKKNSQSLSMPLPAWLFGHDAQGYAYEGIAAAASSIENGTEYILDNEPPPGQEHRVYDFKAEDASPWVRGETAPRARL
ncbi:hypothetical protein PV11_03443 [Exophiala sideris]|uniref:FAD-binding domain-containing protein n=1 Tax=Exophiala sideris TaxID=1016849 RepID=A0A0D1ZMC6_9EURO|nr:hypothetical protein PV11_03443 [Exophiala sideris]